MSRTPTLTNAERHLLRAFITSHERWNAYRAETGINAAALTSIACLAYCKRFGIEPSQAIATQRARQAETTPTAPREFFAPKTVTTPEQVKRPVYTDLDPRQADPAPNTETDAAAALAHAIRLLGGSGTVDPAQVQEIVQAAVAPLAARLDAIQTPAPAIHFVKDDKKLGELPSIRHPQAETICKLALTRNHDGLRPNIWIAGPMGSGKTTLARQVAAALGLAFGFHGSAMLPHEFLGFVDGHGNYHVTQFVKLYRDGGLCLIDEIDGSSAQATLALNAALANGVLSAPNGEIIERHPDFVCIGAANTWGLGATHEYVGRNRLDAAFLDRFAFKLTMDYDPALELALAGGDTAITDVIKAARSYCADHGLKVAISPRTGAAMAQAIASGLSMSDACDLTFCAGLSPDQSKDIKIACGVSRPRR